MADHPQQQPSDGICIPACAGIVTVDAPEKKQHPQPATNPPPMVAEPTAPETPPTARQPATRRVVFRHTAKERT
jgi:hypothetical protein